MPVFLARPSPPESPMRPTSGFRLSGPSGHFRSPIKQNPRVSVRGFALFLLSLGCGVSTRYTPLPSNLFPLFHGAAWRRVYLVDTPLDAPAAETKNRTRLRGAVSSRYTPPVAGFSVLAWRRQTGPWFGVYLVDTPPRLLPSTFELTRKLSRILIAITAFRCVGLRLQEIKDFLLDLCSTYVLRQAKA